MKTVGRIKVLQSHLLSVPRDVCRALVFLHHHPGQCLHLPFMAASPTLAPETNQRRAKGDVRPATHYQFLEFLSVGEGGTVSHTPPTVCPQPVLCSTEAPVLQILLAWLLAASPWWRQAMECSSQQEAVQRA